jgi:chromosome segregation ATPase
VEYSNLTVEEQATCFYTKQIESQTLLSLNYQGLFVVAIGAIQELKAKVETLETDLQTTKEELQTTKEELQSEKNKVATMELLVASLVKRVGDLENLVI